MIKTQNKWLVVLNAILLIIFIPACLNSRDNFPVDNIYDAFDDYRKAALLSSDIKELEKYFHPTFIDALRNIYLRNKENFKSETEMNENYIGWLKELSTLTEVIKAREISMIEEQYCMGIIGVGYKGETHMLIPVELVNNVWKINEYYVAFIDDGAKWNYEGDGGPHICHSTVFQELSAHKN